MTDFELISLYGEQVTLFISVMTLLVTILFSYLVAMFFVSHRLSLFLFWILNGLFVLIMFAQSGAIFASGTRAISIGIQIVDRIESEGSTLAWLQMNHMPPNIPTVMRYFFLSGTLFAVIYAVLHRRNKNSK